MFDRWYDSADWKPWTPFLFKDDVRQRPDPDAPRPEIAANEEKHRQLIEVATTARSRTSALSGRDVLDPSQMEKLQLLFWTFVDREHRTPLIMPATIMGPLVSCVPLLTMAAARVDPQQHIYGTPCMPKP